MGISLGNLRVMVVDDSFEAMQLIRSMLDGMGINQVFTAKDGREALDFLGDCDDMIDVILCDWNMPGLSGIEILRQLRTVDPDFPFIMVTGRGTKDAVSVARDAGATSYILKPFSAQQLEKKMGVMARLIAARAG